MRTRADVIQKLELPGGMVETDEAGYLVDPADWTAEFALHIAARDQIDMTELHWQIIEFMRQYLDEYGVAADVRHVQTYLAETQDLDKHAAKARLYELFPAGHVQHTCKMAGMRQPRAWSTG
jgi:tRNA 2-thiouridine synthesizing protein E